MLLGMRMTGLMLIAPVFSAKTIPIMVRTALIVLFTILLQPAARLSIGLIPAITPLTVVGEMLIGFAIGLGAALVVAAAEAAGDLLSIQIGLSGASLMDPLTNTSSPLLANFLSLFAVTLLLSLDAHLGMLSAVGKSLSLLPTGSAIDLERGLGAMISLAGTLFALGLKFAAPVVAVIMIGNTALAVLSRAAPQLNVLSVAFPLQIGLGLIALGIAIPFIATYFVEWPAVYDSQLTVLFRALIPGGR